MDNIKFDQVTFQRLVEVLIKFIGQDEILKHLRMNNRRFCWLYYRDDLKVSRPEFDILISLLDEESYKDLVSILFPPIEPEIEEPVNKIKPTKAELLKGKEAFLNKSIGIYNRKKAAIDRIRTRLIKKEVKIDIVKAKLKKEKQDLEFEKKDFERRRKAQKKIDMQDIEFEKKELNRRTKMFEEMVDNLNLQTLKDYELKELCREIESRGWFINLKRKEEIDGKT